MQIYQSWLQEMEPFLKCGFSLHQAIRKAGLSKYKDSIYRNYRLKGEFCEKIPCFQRCPGEIVQSIFARIIRKAYSKTIRKESLTSQEVRILCWFSTHHRSAAPFFVNYREKHFRKFDAFGEEIRTPIVMRQVKPPKIKYISSSNT